MLSTVNDVIKQVSEQAIVPTGSDGVTVDGHKAAKVVVQNLPLAKEAYEQLLRTLQDPAKAAKPGQADATVMIYTMVLTALAGGIANVTGDNSYVTRLSELMPE